LIPAAQAKHHHIAAVGHHQREPIPAHLFAPQDTRTPLAIEPTETANRITLAADFELAARR
jgi:hypothetical protein